MASKPSEKRQRVWVTPPTALVDATSEAPGAEEELGSRWQPSACHPLVGTQSGQCTLAIRFGVEVWGVGWRQG